MVVMQASGSVVIWLAEQVWHEHMCRRSCKAESRGQVAVESCRGRVFVVCCLQVSIVRQVAVVLPESLLCSHAETVSVVPARPSALTWLLTEAASRLRIVPCRPGCKMLHWYLCSDWPAHPTWVATWLHGLYQP